MSREFWAGLGAGVVASLSVALVSRNLRDKLENAKQSDVLPVEEEAAAGAARGGGEEVEILQATVDMLQLECEALRRRLKGCGWRIIT